MKQPLDCEKAIIICDLHILEVDKDRITLHSGDVTYLQRSRSRTTFLATWAVTICIFCTVVNCWIALQHPELAPSLLEPVFSVTKEQYQIFHQSAISTNHHDLTDPVNDHLARKIISYPVALVQTDLTASRYVVNEASISGGMLHVNRTSSIILQFAAVGPGIRRCELMLRLTPDAMPSMPSTHASSFHISIHQVAQFLSLDIPTLPQAELPRQLMNIGYFEAAQGTAINWSQTFECTWEEVFTFEVACFEPGTQNDSVGECDLEWWQTTDHEDSYKNILMIQHGSVV